MHLNKIFLVITFLLSFNIFAIADHHENEVVVEDAIVVESDFDLNEAYETKDYSDIDPIEGFNREVWDFNLGLDKVLVRPVTRGYVNVVPDPFRRGLGNAIENFFSTPQYAINNLLQGKIGGFFTTVSRLVINSTIGLGGFIDVASNMGFISLFFSALIPLNHMGGLMVLAMLSTSFGTLTILASLIQILNIKKI